MLLRMVHVASGNFLIKEVEFLFVTFIKLTIISRRMRLNHCLALTFLERRISHSFNNFQILDHYVFFSILLTFLVLTHLLLNLLLNQERSVVPNHILILREIMVELLYFG